MPPYSDFVTVTVYSVDDSPFVTVIFTVFSPDCHVAALPLSTGVSPTIIATLADSSAGVAVMVFDAFVVVVV